MAIREELILDASGALRQAEALERALREAVEVEPTGIERLEAGLRDAERAARELDDLTRATAGAAQTAEGGYRGVAAALGTSEARARDMTREIVEGQARTAELEIEARQLADALGLSERQARDLVTQLDRAGRAEGGVATLTTGVDRLRTSFLRLGGGILAAVGVRGAIQGIDALVDSFATFEDSLNQSLAIVEDLTPALREQLGAAAREVGVNFRVSAKDAADALFFLASAGLSAEQSLAALPQIASFAQAGMFDMATATSLLVDSQKALGLAVPDAVANLGQLTRVSDVLVRANVLSNASVQEFAEALTNRAAAAARLVGVSVEETVAVLAAFAEQGVKGAVAGEAFAIVLRDLQRAALEEPEAFRELGIAVFDAAGNLRPLADVIADLEGALADLSDEQKRATITTLGFQDRSVSNLLTLLGTSDAIRRYTDQLEAAGGATSRLADRQLQSLAARLDVARNRIEDARISIGEGLAPAVEALAEAMPAIVQGFVALVPAITAAAQAAGQFFGSEGFGQIGGFLADLPRGFGQVIDSQKLVTSTLIDGSRVIGSIFSGSLREAGDALGDLGDNFTRFRERTGQRIITQALISDLREGADATTAFANALAGVRQTGAVIDPQFIRNLAQIAGLDTGETVRGLQAVFREASRLGLSAPEVDALRNALTDLIDNDIEAIRQQRFLAQASQDLAGSLGSPIGAAEDLAGAVEDLGESADQGAVPIRNLSDALARAAEATAGAAAGVGESLDLFAESAERLGTTSLEALQNLRDQVTAAAEFEANIIRLIAAGLDDLAGELLERGPAAAQAAQGFVRDINQAAEAEALLEGQGTAAARRVGDELAAELRSGRITQQTVEAFTRLAGQLDSPQIVSAFLAAARSVSGTTGEGFREGLEEEFGRLTGETAPVLTASMIDALEAAGLSSVVAAALREAFGSVEVTDAAADAGAAAAQAFMEGVRGPGGFAISSPSKVIVALARQLAADLGDAFGAGLDLRIPAPTAPDLSPLGRRLAEQIAAAVRVDPIEVEPELRIDPTELGSLDLGRIAVDGELDLSALETARVLRPDVTLDLPDIPSLDLGTVPASGRIDLALALSESLGGDAVVSAAELAGRSAAEGFAAGLRSGLGIASPSTVMVALGRQLATDLSAAFSAAVRLEVPAVSVGVSVAAGTTPQGRAQAIAGQVSGLLGRVRL